MVELRKDEVKGFHWFNKSIRVGIGKKEAFNAAEKGLNAAQHNLGSFYKDGERID
ncbi:10897_t:CDS:2, partial [Diversispora eburnea]